MEIHPRLGLDRFFCRGGSQMQQKQLAPAAENAEYSRIEVEAAADFVF